VQLGNVRLLELDSLPKGESHMRIKPACVSQPGFQRRLATAASDARKICVCCAKLYRFYLVNPVTAMPGDAEGLNGAFDCGEIISAMVLPTISHSS